ncbi:Hypothetical predicted protein, partial [Mytilus galloprovincialis]
MLPGWFNYNSDFSRNIQVAELKKYIDVDVYGKCGKPCSTWMDDSCFKNLGGDYKFYLAFENSHCEDYVTEKAFRLYQELQQNSSLPRGTKCKGYFARWHFYTNTRFQITKGAG